MNAFKVGAVFVFFAAAAVAQATPGGLDASGCHQPKKGHHHCHEGKKVMGQATRAQCKLIPNDGWCTKYKKAKAEENQM